MKRYSLFLSVCILLLSSETTFAQTASSYYMPLRVGNYLQFQSSDRATNYSIIRSDSISGHLYFLEKRLEVMVGTGETKVYALFWLRKDAAGEILLGAMGATGSVDGSWSSNLDSATIFDPPGPFFSNQFIVPGYAYGYSRDGYTWVDTTMSNTETVQSTAGTFTNCVKIRETKRLTSNDSLIYVEYTYYAPGMGIVKVARDGWSMNDLIGYNTLTSVNVKNEPVIPSGFGLYQNYPNPFNPSTDIKFSVAITGRAIVEVYNTVGQRVAMLFDEAAQAGQYYRATLDGANLASGLYFATLRSGNSVATRKMILLK